MIVCLLTEIESNCISQVSVLCAAVQADHLKLPILAAKPWRVVVLLGKLAPTHDHCTYVCVCVCACVFCYSTEILRSSN